MKTTFYHRLSIFALAAVLLCGCSELKKGTPTTNPVFVYVHPAGFRSPSSPDFHGKAVQAAGWEMRDCRQCHGGTYSGANAISCLNSGCHVDASGNAKSPESCNTCHGSFAATVNDTLSWAPPRSVAGDTSTMAYGVGAHRSHLLGTGNDSSTPVPCAGCHTIPSTVYASGHITSQGRAQVLITAALATVSSGGTTPTPAYDAQNMQCGNSYCHGNWQLRKSASQYPFVYTDSLMKGANYSPKWTGGASEAACGTCHGLPPAGHLSQGISLAQCTSCHYGVVDGSGKIIDKTKHMNGKIDVYGDELSFK
jgi:predicted CxxxxCH...CXXCH cytochrome family protein